MRPQRFVRTTLLAAALFAASRASAEGAGVGIKVSSLGIGAEFTKSLTPRVNVRVGGNFFNYSYSGSEDDIDYDFELKLKSFTGLVDLHPTGGSFRLSGGFLANSNKLDAIGVTSGTYSIGNGSYTVPGRDAFREDRLQEARALRRHRLRQRRQREGNRRDLRSRRRFPGAPARLADGDGNRVVQSDLSERSQDGADEPAGRPERLQALPGRRARDFLQVLKAAPLRS